MKAKHIVAMGLMVLVALYALDVWRKGFSLSVASYYGYSIYVSIGALFILRDHENNSDSRLTDLYLWPRRVLSKAKK
ncbi:hypothetical protein [Vibrio alginolyticus]|uniref:hypothetical protein n=1 Tax=Vibrio alginolyticus TaxID=663 RepID=UPI0006CA863E|nr:hypothetical protein [Vibrio alginolyticus]KPM97618.1 hypothetical protein AOG25_14235 [Vibrio alginolyticus]